MAQGSDRKKPRRHIAKRQGGGEGQEFVKNKKADILSAFCALRAYFLTEMSIRFALASQ